MKFTGQGPKIFLSCLPVIIFSLIENLFFPKVFALPISKNISFIIGCVVLFTGLTLWCVGFFQLMKYFRKRQLATTGLFSISRNPLYASIILFIIPSFAFLTCQWSYFIVAFVSWLSFTFYIHVEEDVLLKTFGIDYVKYSLKVNRFFPKLKK
jgi:protein-S-isoprenylcysteine O-methyltransferase Ste14